MRSFALLATLVFLMGAWADVCAADTKVAERRIALVVGNARYAAVPLPNPTNDARLIASNLRKLGFEVNEQLDLAVIPFRRALREFARRAQEPGVSAVFYYAGHGMQIDGRNYLLPVDLNLRDQEEVKDESIDIEELLLSRLDRSGGAGGARIVILDSCRDNPFAGRTRSIKTASGLAEMAARGALIAYASAPGAPAEDGPGGQNSVYTRALAEEMMMPGVEVEQMFKTVRMRVLRDTQGRQVPWVNTSLISDFRFNPAPAGPTASERALQERVQLLESQLARERHSVASADGRVPSSAQTMPLQTPLTPARESAGASGSQPEAATPPVTAATERIDRLTSELSATRQEIVTSNAPPPVELQAAAREALASAVAPPNERHLLRKDELEQMMVGKNQTFVHFRTGETYKWYVRGDGNVFYKNQTSGRVGYGAWTIGEDGRFCVRWNSSRSGNDGCMFYFNEGGKIVRTGSSSPLSKAHAQILEVR